MTTRPDLQRFFAPATVAVVGATDDEGRQSTYAWHQIRDWGIRHGASVVPVHPGRTSVDGIATVSSLAELDGPVDVVASLVSDPLPVARQAATNGAGFLVVFAAGFAETGTDGRIRQDELRDALAGSSTRLIGPNTNLNAFEPLDRSLPGPGLALLTQSGHQGRPLYLLQQIGVPITHWAPTGNEADVDAADFLSWFATRPEVGAVAAYLEGLPDGRRFIAAAAEARDRGVPVVAVKVGRTSTGSRAASSHTGALTGSDRVVDVAFASAGIVRVDDLDDLADTSTLLARAGAPSAPGVAVYAMSGGSCSLLADQLAGAGLTVPRLGPATRSSLRELIAGFLPVDNPVDCGGPPMADERGAAILDLLAGDPAIGCVIAAVSGAVPGYTDRLVADLQAAAVAHPDVAFALVWGSPHMTDPSFDIAQRDPAIATFRTGRGAATALAAWHRWHRDGPAGAPSASAVFRPRRALVSAVDEASTSEADAGEWSARTVLAAAGVPLVEARHVATATAAVRAWNDLGGPVVLKADVAGLAHRAVLGLVEVGVDSAATVRRSAAALLVRAEEVAPGRVRGLIVARLAAPGPEVLVGATWDPSFGPVVTVGHGGVDTELIASTAVALAPFTRRRATSLLKEVTGWQRWRDVGDDTWRDLVSTVVALGDVAVAAGPSLGAVEVNPVRLTDGGAVALDAWAYRYDSKHV